MRKTFILTLFLFILVIQGCHTYLIDKESAAKQMTNLKIEKDYGSGIVSGSTDYSNNLKYLIVKNELHSDTIVPTGISFYLKSGIKSGYIIPKKVIFKDGYFISFKDTTLKTHPKCKTCRINIDSVEKIIIRGSRIINFVSYNNSRWHIEYRMGLTANFFNYKTKFYFDNYFTIALGASLYYRNVIFSYSFNPTTILRVKKTFYNEYGDTIRKYANTLWKTNGPYSINLVKHNFDIGYEIRTSNKNSFTPTLGFSLGRINIKDSANYIKKLPLFYDLTLGLSYKRFVEISKGARFFYGVQSYAGYSKISDKYSVPSSPYWSLTINCGFKFVPKGLIALGVLSNLDKAYQ